MEVHFSSDLHRYGWLSSAATKLVEHYVDHDAWFRQKVKKGLEQLDRGEYLTHEEAGERIERIPFVGWRFAGLLKPLTISPQSSIISVKMIPQPPGAYRQDIYQRADALMTFPDRGRPGQVEGTRELALPQLPFIVVYWVLTHAVEIVNIMHGAQR